MLLQCERSFCLVWLLPALVVALNLNEIDKSLSPRLVGMIYNLYKPSVSTKRPPIIVDCDHPGVLCQFGTKPLVARPISECNCKGDVPIVTGLVAEQQNSNEESSETVSPKTPDNIDEVPIYKGEIDMEAVLNSGANLQKKPVDKSSNKHSSTLPDDLYQKRFGELPKKFASYYPYSKPVLVNDPEEFEPDFDHGPPFFFPGMFGPDKRHPFPSKNGPPLRPPANSKPAKPTSVTTTKRPATLTPSSSTKAPTKNT